MAKKSSCLFLNKDPNDTSHNWSEFLIQCYVVQEARRDGFMVASSQEQGVRSKAAGGKAKAAGMVRGEPDLRFYLDGGVVVFVELKTDEGALSKEQVEYHKKLERLGHEVHTVKADCPGAAWGQIRGYLVRIGVDDEKIGK